MAYDYYDPEEEEHGIGGEPSEQEKAAGTNPKEEAEVLTKEEVKNL